jgi:DNA-binding MarR family transcriptional regulator
MSKDSPPNSQLDIDQALCFALYQASKEMTKAYAPLLDQLGVTYPQFLVLVLLWEKDEQNVKDLGKQLSLDSGTLTPLLKRLEAAELIDRVRSKKDEREVHISLTAKGKKLKTKALQIPGALLCKINMSIEDLIKTRDSVKKVYLNLVQSNSKNQK